jgi:hypothetical protein
MDLRPTSRSRGPIEPLWLTGRAGVGVLQTAGGIGGASGQGLPASALRVAELGVWCGYLLCLKFTKS